MFESHVEPSLGAREWGLLVTLSALWGGSFFFFKVLVAELPQFTIVLGRVGVAALALNLLVFARRDYMPRDLRLWGSFLIMGLLNNVVPFTLVAFAESSISSGLASILNATTPIFTVLVAHLFTSSEKLSWPKVVGILLGFAGVAVLIGPAALIGTGQSGLVGEAACLLAAVTYAFAGAYGRKFKGIQPLKVATGQISASTIILLPLAGLLEHPWTLPAPSAAAWYALIGIALLSTALAYILYFRILSAAGATNLLLVTFLVPISAMGLGVLVLHETVTWQAIGGMTMIGMGLAAIDGRAVAWLLRLRQPAAQPSGPFDDYVI